jgi:acrylyl-CoA reductase (NADPH)
MFKAIYLTKDNDQFAATVREVADAELDAATPGDDVTIAVQYSTINYKDGLALTNKSPVVRKWPMVAGIDAAGTVIASGNALWQAGDKVVLNGWGVGETHWGGLAQKARARAEWLVRIPLAFSTRDAAAIGTAGYTAALCVLALRQHGVEPAQGEVLVTGATGGVGSVAVALLAALDYKVVAATRRSSTARNSPRPASRCKRSAGPAWSMPWAATHWPTPVRRPRRAARWRPVDSRRAWIFRRQWRRSFCAG